MNKPKSMGRDSKGNFKYSMHRFMAKGFMVNSKTEEISRTFGRPVKKASRVGWKGSKLNKTGHRQHKG